MKVLAFSDLHGTGIQLIEKIRSKEENRFDQSDLVILLGDMSKQEVAAICEAAPSDVPVLGVFGNHDKWSQFAGTRVRAVDGSGIIVNHDNGIDSPLKVSGLSGSPRYKPGASFVMRSQEEAFSLLLGAQKNIGLFLSHDGGYHWLDDDFTHCGFSAIDEYLSEAKPEWMLFGHHHKACEMVFRTQDRKIEMIDGKCFQSLVGSESESIVHCVCVYGGCFIDMDEHDVEFIVA